MKTIQIFFPINYYFNCKKELMLIGDVQINLENICFYITDAVPFEKIVEYSEKCIGQISFDSGQCFDTIPLNKNFIYFTTNQNAENITYNRINIENTNELKEQLKIQIIIYDTKIFKKISIPKNDCQTDDDNTSILHLVELLKFKNALQRNSKLTISKSFFEKSERFLQPAFFILNFFGKETAVAKHFVNWKHILWNNLTSESKWTLGFDIIAGIMLMLLLFHLGNPSLYLINSTELVVKTLQNLLDSLKGSPVGLKLNVELNHFFLDCFTYHIELWAKFLIIVSPAIQYLFIPLGIIGCLGISFQLAMLSDLLVLISLHAHCFYIYAAILYHVEITGISALWRVIRGRRQNPLKGRVESHEYTNSQLYLATMFFSALLFFLPTVLIYYIVFASLRFCLHCISYSLVLIQNKILTLPIFVYVTFLFSKYYNAYNIEISFPKTTKTAVKHQKSHVSVIQITPIASIPKINHFSISKNDSLFNDILPIDKFFTALLKSELIGFIHLKKRCA